MARTVTDYRDLLLALLPQGDAWNTDPASPLGQLMTGLAEEFARIDARAEDLLNESDPRTVFELVDEWEAEYGLPDSCQPGERSLTQHRDALLQKVATLGGQSRQFFIDLAAALGYTITITEYQARLCGRACGEAYGDTDWNHTWQVNAATHNPKQRFMGDPMGEPYAAWSSTELECVIRKLVHAHRHIIFSYT